MLLQRVGGSAAIINALVYLIGFAMAGTVLNPGNIDAWTPAQKLIFVLEKGAIFQLWMIVIYVVFGISLVVLTVALHERLKERVAGLMQIASAFGLIWAGLVIASGMISSVGLDEVAKIFVENPEKAVSMWTTIGVIQNGLGGGVEVIGGLWVVLVSSAALTSAAYERALGILGLVVGASGLLTIIPALSDLGAVFGASQIVWFSWLAVVMLRRTNN